MSKDKLRTRNNIKEKQLGEESKDNYNYSKYI